MKTKKEPIKASNYFCCATCNSDKKMSPEEALDHLKFHNLTKVKGTKKMTSHLDCADSFHSTYEWTFGGVTLYQYCTNPRRKATRFV